MKILYVENHAIFAEQVCREFLSAHEVKVVSSIAGALEELIAENYDLAIVDYDLDDGKGDELVRICRFKHPTLKIIAGSSHEPGNAALVRAGASAVCGKMSLTKLPRSLKR